MTNIEQDLKAALPEVVAKIDEIQYRLMGERENDLEMEKLRRLGPQIAETVRFLRWLNSSGIVLAQPNPVIGMLSSLDASVDHIAATYHGIDMLKLEEERAAFLKLYDEGSET